MQRYRDAIAAVESRGRGDYDARGPVVASGRYAGEQALGRYQIMPGNLPEWSQAALGRQVTPEEFMQSPALQDQIFDHRFGLFVNQHGNPQDAASVWFTGRPQATGGGASDGFIDGNQYVSRFNNALGEPMTPTISAQNPRGQGILPDMPQPQGQPRGQQVAQGLAMAFNQLRARPDQNMAGNFAAQNEQQAATRSKNATVDWLRSQGRDDLAGAVEAGTISGRDAFQMMQPGAPVKGVEVNGRLVNPVTGEVMGDFSDAPESPDSSPLRKEFSGLAPVKAFSTQADAYGRMVASATNPSPAGDMALIFNYMKLLDPGSTVREGEFASAEQAGGVDTQIRNLYNRIIDGTRLSPEQRKDFLSRAQGLYQSAEQGFTNLYDQYAGIAGRMGLPLEDALIDFRYSGETMQAPGAPPPDRATPAQSVNAANIRAAYQMMSPQDRTAFDQIQNPQDQIKFLRDRGFLP